MALRKWFSSVIFFIILTNESYSQTSDYWQKAIQTAFSNSPNVNEIKLEYNSAIINKKQYDYQWFPQFQANLQEKITLSGGKNYYLLSQESDPSYVHIFSPSLQLNFYQKLPGNGSIGLSTSYGFNFLAERNVFQQWPQINLSINQTLGQGMMGINGNPESLLMNEQMYYSLLMYERNLTLQIQDILLLFQNLDILCSQEDYYFALQTEYESELKTAKNKEAAGLQSSMEAYYAKHQLTEVQSKLKNLQNSKQQLVNEICLLVPDFIIKDLSAKRKELFTIINTIYQSSNIEKNFLETNLYNTIYASIQKQYLYQFQNNETNYAPQLVISSSISPDGNENVYYSDWYKSFRILTENTSPLNFTMSLGIQKKFELPEAKKLRKEIYTMNKDSIEEQIKFSNQTQTYQLEILRTQIKKDTDYLVELESSLLTEQDFRNKRRDLLKQNIITQDEFFQSETTYFKIYSDYINTFWNIINNKLSVIDLCSSEFLILKTFIGDTNEF